MGGLTLDYTDGWDQFGRVTSQTWTNAAETTTFDDFTYTYDRASSLRSSAVAGSITVQNARKAGLSDRPSLHRGDWI